MIRFCFPSELAVPDPDTLLVSDAHGLHFLRLAPAAHGGVTVVSCATLRYHDDDEGPLCVSSCSSRLILASATCLYRHVEGQTLFSPRSGAGSLLGSGFALWAGEEGMRGRADGDGAHARFHSIAAVGDDGQGGAVVVDAQADGSYTVRRISCRGDVTTVCTTAAVDDDTADDSHEDDDDNGHCRGANLDDNYMDCTDQHGWRPSGDAYSDDASSVEGSSSQLYHSGGCANDGLHGGVCDGSVAGSSAAFRSGPLRCPMVLPGGALLLCAPRLGQGSLLLVSPSGEEEATRSGLPVACTTAAAGGDVAAGSFPADPAALGGLGCSIVRYGMYSGSSSPCPDDGPASSCDSSSGSNSASALIGTVKRPAGDCSDGEWSSNEGWADDECTSPAGLDLDGARASSGGCAAACGPSLEGACRIWGACGKRRGVDEVSRMASGVDYCKRSKHASTV